MQCRRDEALQLQEEVPTLSRKVLGPEHSHTLMAMNDLASSYGAVGRRDEVLQLRKEALTLRPDDATAHNEAAWILATSPDKDKRYPQAKQAVEWGRRANELAPDNGAILNTLGVALYRAEQWQETIDVLQQSIKLGNDVPHNWLFIAMAHRHLDQKDKAKQWYDKSLANDGASGGKTNAETGTKKSKTPPADSESNDESDASGNGD